MRFAYEYKTVNISLEPTPDDEFRKATIVTAANRWAEEGWRTVAVMPSRGVGYADRILIERRKLPVGIEVEYEGKTLIFPYEEVRTLYTGED